MPADSGTASRRGFGTFLTLWLGLVVSVLGSRVMSFALGVSVFRNTGSVTRFALISLSAALPVILLSPIAGAVADRFDRRHILLLGSFGSVCVNLVLYRLTSAGLLTPSSIYPLVAINGVFTAFSRPTLSASVTLLVGKTHLARASGLVRTGFSLAGLCGPLLGGIALTAVGLPKVILLNIFSYFAVLIVLLVIRIPAAERRTSAKGAAAAAAAGAGTMASGSIRSNMAVGWRFVRQHPGLLHMLLILSASRFFVTLVLLLITPLLLSIANATALGVVLSLASAGTLVGSTSIIVWGGPKRRILAIFIVTFLQGTLLIIGSIWLSISLIGAVAFLFTIGFPISGAAGQATWQSKTPPEIQGRVFGLLRIIGGTSIPLAQILVGPLADLVFEPAMAPGGALAGVLGPLVGVGEGSGVALMVLISGIVMVTIAFSAALLPRVRRLEDEIADAIEDDGAEVPRALRAAAATSALRRMAPTARRAVLLLPIAAGIFALIAERPPDALGSDAPRNVFAAGRALGHLEAIAAEPHATGSAANQRVRRYLEQQLTGLGLEVDVQRADARLEGGVIASLISVENVLGRLRGSEGPPAVLLVAHYDSVPTSPGASDDGVGVAALLETARVLTGEARPRHDVIFLFTDAEEVGRHGATAFLREHPWAPEIAVAINLEARGNLGPVYMFQTGDDNGWWTDRFFEAVPQPRTNSLAPEIFRRLPNATDFSIFRRGGLPGFDLAMIGGLTHYHTGLDTVADVDPRSLQHHGDHALALARSLANLDLHKARRVPRRTYFTALGTCVRYPTWLARLSAALVLLLTGLVIAAGLRSQRLSGFGMMQGFLALFALLILVPVAISILWMILRDKGGVPVIMGSTAEAPWFIAGFVLTAVALTLTVHGFFRRSAGALDLAAGAMLWWAIAVVLTTDTVLAAPSNFVAVWPLGFAALGLGWLCVTKESRLSRWPTALVLAATAVPAVVIMLPLLITFYIALQGTVQLAGVALVLWVLLFGLLVPHLEAAGRVATRALPIAAAFLGAAAISIGLAGSVPVEMTSAVYTYDHETAEARWFSFDPSAGAWHQAFGLVNGQTARFDRFFPLMRRPLLSSQPMDLDTGYQVPLPEMVSLHAVPAAGPPTVELELVAAPASRGRLILFDPPAAVASVSIDGVPVNLLGRAAPSRVLTRLPVRAREQLRLRLRDRTPFVMTVVEQLDSLPPAPRIERRAGNLPRPMLSVIRTDVTLVRRSFTIDPGSLTEDFGDGAPEPAAGNEASAVPRL